MNVQHPGTNRKRFTIASKRINWMAVSRSYIVVVVVVIVDGSGDDDGGSGGTVVDGVVVAMAGGDEGSVVGVVDMITSPRFI